MRYVIDSSVARKWVLPESDSAKAIQLRDEYLKGLHQLLAPDFFPIEVGHALTRAERAGRLSSPDGWTLWQSEMADCPSLHVSLPLMPRAYVLSSAMRIGIDDCIYAALAEAEQCQLVTADNRLIQALGSPFLVHLSSL